MSTYRERREVRSARLTEWAEKREAKAAAVVEAGEPFRSDYAFNTQPGHIPFRAKLIAREDRAHESLAKARDMKRRAEGIKSQLGSSIYSDDPDAVDRLRERLAVLEAERDRIKAYNASCRKGARDLSLLDDAQRELLLRVVEVQPYAIGKKGEFPGYHLTNLSGNIKRNRDRLERLEREQAETGRLMRYCGECGVGPFFVVVGRDRPELCLDCAEVAR